MHCIEKGASRPNQGPCVYDGTPLLYCVGFAVVHRSTANEERGLCVRYFDFCVTHLSGYEPPLRFGNLYSSLMAVTSMTVAPSGTSLVQSNKLYTTYVSNSGVTPGHNLGRQCE